MPGAVSYANWTITYSIPALTGGGLYVTTGNYQGKRVFGNLSQPFVLVPYHGGSPGFKDGVAPACGGAAFTALVPTAPDASGHDLPAWAKATNDKAYNAMSNPGGAVVVERRPATFTDPASLVISAKFALGVYQFMHRWEFRADGLILGLVGLGGKLFRLDEATGGHVHNFYFRLDLDIVSADNNLVQRFDHPSNEVGSDGWQAIPVESVQFYDPKSFTKWRVINKSPKPNGLFPSYELIPSSEGSPDGTVSTADLWVVRYKNNQRGAEVGCTDAVLSNSFVNGESVDGADVVMWYCVRTHHEPRGFGEERRVLPYKFIGFRLEPRDFLDDTPRGLYPTIPPSP